MRANRMNDSDLNLTETIGQVRAEFSEGPDCDQIRLRVQLSGVDAATWKALMSMAGTNILCVTRAMEMRRVFMLSADATSNKRSCIQKGASARFHW